MRKQIFYLTNTRLTACMWQGGMLSDGQAFENNEAGWAAFAEYLGGSPKAPAVLLADLIEEDFQSETIPHVLGKARNALIQRRLSQVYRDSALRQASLQGREKSGRRDDRLLLSALTNSELTKPWLEAILQQQVPLMGIYSLALLSALIFNKLRLPAGPVLLVTAQSSGLRQSYFHDGHLKFSRLTPLDSQEPEHVAAVTMAEVAKTRLFLTSTRLMARGDRLHTGILVQSGWLPAYQRHFQDTSDTTLQLLELEAAAQLLGFKNLRDMTLCDPLFISVLGDKNVASHYTLFEHSRFYHLWQGRIALYAFSGIAVAAGLFLAGANTIEALDTSQQTRQLQVDTRAAETQYQGVIKSMPPTVANPHDMKLAVDLEQLIAQNAPAPAQMLGLLSRALDRHPRISVTSLKWQASESSTGEADSANAPPPAADADAPPSAALIGVPNKPIQTLLVEGEVLPFQNDYRTALESVKQLSADLSRDKKMKVEVIRQPLDTRPAVKLAGQAGKDKTEDKALFNLKLVWRP